MAGNKFDDRCRKTIREGLAPNLSVVAANAEGVLVRFREGAMSYSDARPIGPDTPFNVGSTTKMFTAALVAALAEDGELTLDDPVRRFVPEFAFANVTVSHLLTHTSGIREENLGWPGLGRREEFLTRLYANERSNSAPGERFAYYSAGYSMLMDAIERVSGASIEAFARERLFDPLGMANTTYDASKLRTGQYTVPCFQGGPDLSGDDHRLAASGDSGMYSTADDLVRFGRMLLRGGELEGRRVFGEATVELLFRERTGGRFAFSALGMVKSDAYPHDYFGDLNSPGTVGHPGYSGCMLWIDRGFGLTGAIVSNGIKLHENWRNYRALVSVSLDAARREAGNRA